MSLKPNKIKGYSYFGHFFYMLQQSIEKKDSDNLHTIFKKYILPPYMGLIVGLMILALQDILSINTRYIILIMLFAAVVAFIITNLLIKEREDSGELTYQRELAQRIQVNKISNEVLLCFQNLQNDFSEKDNIVNQLCLLESREFFLIAYKELYTLFHLDKKPEEYLYIHGSLLYKIFQILEECKSILKEQNLPLPKEFNEDMQVGAYIETYGEFFSDPFLETVQN